MSPAAARAAAAMRDMGAMRVEPAAEPAPVQAPEPVAGARVWSPQQQAIFAAVEAPPPEGVPGHIVIEALAGTGKSTTIEECTRRTLEGSQVLVCAFNKAIADAMRDRLPGDCDVMTLHSYGLRTLTRSMGRREISKYDYVHDMAAESFGRSRDTKEARSALVKLVSLAKGQLTEASTAALDELADAFDIAPGDKGPARREWLKAAASILQRCAKASTGPINFDDMIWLPAVHGLCGFPYDWVFVDETQDLNAAQLVLVRSAARDGGRIVAVGDRHQAIYGFRGADREAIPRMIKELGAQTLPLSVTYRCPRAVVREANRFVPALQAAPGAAAGDVREATEPELFEQAAPGDFVLSRTNAPLISLCWRWLAAGRRAQMQGRDFADGLISLMRQLAAAQGDGCSAVAMLQRLAAWAAKETARLEELERDTGAVSDKAACIEAIAEGCSTVAECVHKAERLFAPQAGPSILCSSTHRAQGLEADRVWLLRDTYRVVDGAEREADAEEANLLYVAITRAKSELVYVRETPEAEGESP